MTTTTLLRVAAALLLPALLGSSARAAEYWAESGPVPTRAEATTLRNSLDLDALSRQLDDGDISARVVRRLIEGEGWRFVLRVDGLDDEEASAVAAQAIAGTGVPAAAWMREGDTVSALDGVVTQADAADAAAALSTATAGDLPTARQVLRRAVKAHGGSHDPLERVELATSLRFSYTRDAVLADGHLRARNLLQRLGEALRLDVEVVEGEGVDSTTILTADNRAWVVVASDAQPRDPTRSREVLARFGPESVLAIPLGFTRDVERAAAWQDLAVVAGAELAGGPAWKLAPRDPAADTEGADSEGLVSACFDQVDGRLVQVQWRSRAGLMRFDFDDYRELDDDFVVPMSIAIWRDDVAIELVSIDELALEIPLEATLFSDP